MTISFEQLAYLCYFIRGIEEALALIRHLKTLTPALSHRERE
jgi:hypothetical protein